MHYYGVVITMIFTDLWVTPNIANYSSAIANYDLAGRILCIHWNFVLTIFNTSNAEFTIPEAVNLIVTVDVGNLKELGRKLGVDEVKLNSLSGYVGIGCHQRLIEAWFEQAEHEPTRNVLLEALPRRGSSVSMSSLPRPPTPTFEPTSGKSWYNIILYLW